MHCQICRVMASRLLVVVVALLVAAVARAQTLASVTVTEAGTVPAAVTIQSSPPVSPSTITAGTVNYTVRPSFYATSMGVLAVPTDASDTVTVNSVSHTTTATTVAFAGPSMDVAIVVTKGVLSTTYHLLVRRADEAVFLSCFTKTTTALSPLFNSSAAFDQQYTAKVDWNVSLFVVEPCAVTGGATTTLNGVASATSVSVAATEATYTSPVTATVRVFTPDGLTHTSYVITISRNAVPFAPCAQLNNFCSGGQGACVACESLTTGFKGLAQTIIMVTVLSTLGVIVCTVMSGVEEVSMWPFVGLFVQLLAVTAVHNSEIGPYMRALSTLNFAVTNTESASPTTVEDGWTLLQFGHGIGRKIITVLALFLLAGFTHGKVVVTTVRTFMLRASSWGHLFLFMFAPLSCSVMELPALPAWGPLAVAIGLAVAVLWYARVYVSDALTGDVRVFIQPGEGYTGLLEPRYERDGGSLLSFARQLFGDSSAIAHKAVRSLRGKYWSYHLFGSVGTALESEERIQAKFDDEHHSDSDQYEYEPPTNVDPLKVQEEERVRASVEHLQRLAQLDHDGDAWFKFDYEHMFTRVCRYHPTGDAATETDGALRWIRRHTTVWFQVVELWFVLGFCLISTTTDGPDQFHSLAVLTVCFLVLVLVLYPYKHQHQVCMIVCCTALTIELWCFSVALDDRSHAAYIMSALFMQMCTLPVYLLCQGWFRAPSAVQAHMGRARMYLRKKAANQRVMERDMEEEELREQGVIVPIREEIRYTKDYSDAELLASRKKKKKKKKKKTTTTTTKRRRRRKKKRKNRDNDEDEEEDDDDNDDGKEDLGPSSSVVQLHEWKQRTPRTDTGDIQYDEAGRLMAGEVLRMHTMPKSELESHQAPPLMVMDGVDHADTSSDNADEDDDDGEEEEHPLERKPSQRQAPVEAHEEFPF